MSTLIRQSMKIDEEIAQAEQYLKDLKFKKRKVNEEDIPALMQEMGMDSITVDGNKVALPSVCARSDQLMKKTG